MAKRKRPERPNQYQVYGIGVSRRCTHAGVIGMARMCEREARRAQRKWEAWRRQYLLDNPGEYPLRTEHEPTEMLCVHPVGKPDERKYFDVREAAHG